MDLRRSWSYLNTYADRAPMVYVTEQVAALLVSGCVAHPSIVWTIEVTSSPC